MQYPIEGELEARVSALQRRYREPLFWVEDQSLQRGYPSDDGFVDATEAEGTTVLQADLQLAGDEAVSFEDCWHIEWVPVTNDLELDWGQGHVAQLGAELRAISQTASLPRQAGAGSQRQRSEAFRAVY